MNGKNTVFCVNTIIASQTYKHPLKKIKLQAPINLKNNPIKDTLKYSNNNVVWIPITEAELIIYKHASRNTLRNVR